MPATAAPNLTAAARSNGFRHRLDRDGLKHSRRDVDVFLDQPKLPTAEEQPSQLRAREHGLTPDALDELQIVVGQSAITVRQAVAPTIFDQRRDRETARS